MDGRLDEVSRDTARRVSTDALDRCIIDHMLEHVLYSLSIRQYATDDY